MWAGDQPLRSFSIYQSFRDSMLWELMFVNSPRAGELNVCLFFLLQCEIFDTCIIIIIRTNFCLSLDCFAI